MQLPQINPWLREYIEPMPRREIRAVHGIAAADGKFKGYAKPFLEDVDMYRWEPEKNPLRRLEGS